MGNTKIKFWIAAAVFLFVNIVFLAIHAIKAHKEEAALRRRQGENRGSGRNPYTNNPDFDYEGWVKQAISRPVGEPIAANTQKGTMSRIDQMEGHDFEYWCADLLRRKGFTNVSVTKGSGDMGVDIVAYNNGKKYAIQCKRYNSPLGNKPIQEVVAGKTIYKAQAALVITNNYFTKSATALAKVNNVFLWDRDDLSAFISIRSSTLPKEGYTMEVKKEDMWPHDKNGTEIDVDYYENLPIVEIVEDYKRFIKMYPADNSGFVYWGHTDKDTNQKIEIFSEPIDTTEEATHFAAALTRHCKAEATVENTQDGLQRVRAVAFSRVIRSNWREEYNCFVFANWG